MLEELLLLVVLEKLTEVGKMVIPMDPSLRT